MKIKGKKQNIYQQTNRRKKNYDQTEANQQGAK